MSKLTGGREVADPSRMTVGLPWTLKPLCVLPSMAT